MAEDKTPEATGNVSDPTKTGDTTSPVGTGLAGGSAAEKKGKDAAKNPTLPPAPAKPKTVRVIIPKGATLGRLMLTNGDTTTDPEYVALLDIKGQKKVEAVK